MCEMDSMEFWREQVTEQCNQALLRLRKESVEYDAAVRERVTLSVKVQSILEGDGELLLSGKDRKALNAYMERLWSCATMEEMTACYKQGFGDALRIVIETGALPNQR